jgi:hypothetical protein
LLPVAGRRGGFAAANERHAFRGSHNWQFQQ